MKKRWRAVLSCLLALLLLSGCGSFAGFAGKRSEATVPFGEMLYYRPDTAQMDVLMEELNARLDDGASYRKVAAKLDECFDWYYLFYTMYTLAEVHSYLDVTDAYYAEEFEWISTEFAEVQQAYDKLYYACAGSELGPTLEERYFWEGFCEEYADPEDSVYSDEYVALLQEESDLLARYREMIAEPVIVFNGREQDFYTLIDELYGAAYTRAWQTYYDTYNEPLAEIFIELMRVRCAMAEQLGYDSYEQMQYEFYYERDYGPEDAARYLEQIRQEVVPFYKSLDAMGAYGRVSYDELSERELVAVLNRAADEIGGDVAEAFAFMEEYDLFDVSVSRKKAQMSFETYFPDYEAPFVFLGASGDTGDVLNFAHEFGHFCDAYMNDGALDETIDLAEVYSQGMELLMLSRLKGSLSAEEAENVERMKALDLADLYVQQAAFAEFETRAYALGPDRLSAETLNGIMLGLCKEYGFYSEGFDWAYAMSWIDITHFFEAPFYVISYPVSNDLAMQLYAMELEEEGSGMERYLGVLRHDSRKIMELVEEGGFESPFSEGRVQDAVRLMKLLYGFKGL